MRTLAKLSSLSVSFFTAAIASGAPDDDHQKYAAKCAEELGLEEIPGYDCESNSLPLSASQLLRHSGSRNSIGRVTTANPNVDAAFLCRELSPDGSQAKFNGYILHNNVTGNTCFFDAKMDSSAVVPAPTAAGSAGIWQDPESHQQDCTSCHSADPFITPFYISSEMQALGFLQKDRNTIGPYEIVTPDDPGSQMHSWGSNRLTWPREGCYGACHFLSDNDFYTMDAAKGGGLDGGMLTLALDEYWMGLGIQGYAPKQESPASIGVWRPGPAYFYLDHDGNRQWNNGDRAMQFGITGDRPVVLRGTTCPNESSSPTRAVIGVSRRTYPNRAANHWYITKNNLYWDQADDQNTFVHHDGEPLSWNGSAVTFKDGRFSLDYNHDETRKGDLDIYYGIPGDRPVIGRWKRGIGHRVGVFRNGYWYLDTNGSNLWEPSDGAYSFGIPGDLPIVGDFNGDGVDEIGVYRDGVWYVDSNNTFAWEGTAGGDSIWHFGLPGDIPVVTPGRWNCNW